jgi:hypothetical protein
VLQAGFDLLSEALSESGLAGLADEFGIEADNSFNYGSTTPQVSCRLFVIFCLHDHTE